MGKVAPHLSPIPGSTPDGQWKPSLAAYRLGLLFFGIKLQSFGRGCHLLEVISNKHQHTCAASKPSAIHSRVCCWVKNSNFSSAKLQKGQLMIQFQLKILLAKAVEIYVGTTWS